MPNIAALALTVGSKTVDYVPAGTQNGDKPSLWTTVGSTLSLDQQNTLSHSVTQGTSNRSVRIRGVIKKVSTAEGIDVVSGISGFDVKFTFPKVTIAEDRGDVIDTLIAYLTAQRGVLVATEVMY